MLPKKLKEINHWSVHQDKKPVTPGGIPQLLSYGQAKRILKKSNYSGLSFDFKGTDYSYIDLDSYKKTADVALHKRLVKNACRTTFVETSRSGAGHHIVHLGRNLKGVEAIDSRSNNLLYMTGDSIGQEKIGYLSKGFKKLFNKNLKEGRNLAEPKRKSIRGNRGKRSNERMKKAFDGLREKDGKELKKDFGKNRSDYVFHLLNLARFVTDNDQEAMVELVGKLQVSTKNKGVYPVKRLIKDAKRCIQKSDTEDTYYKSESKQEKFTGFDRHEEGDENNIVDALKFLKEIKEEKMKWRWKNWIPEKKFMIFAAEGGSGKSSVLYDLAARETVKSTFPFSKQKGSGGKVLYITAEDDIADTIKPRFREAGGDMNKLIILDSEHLHLDFTTTGAEDLQDAINSIENLSMIILDPIDAYCGKANTHMASTVKELMGPVNGIARKNNITILGVLHFLKGGDAKNLSLKHMISGSASWTNTARLVLVAFEDPETEDKYLGIVKSNNGTKKKLLKYRIKLVKNDVVKIKFIEQNKINIQQKYADIFNVDKGVEFRMNILKEMEIIIKNKERVLTVETRNRICEKVKGVSMFLVKAVLKKEYNSRNEEGQHYYFKKGFRR